jgi:hypothetical protein
MVLRERSEVFSRCHMKVIPHGLVLPIRVSNVTHILSNYEYTLEGLKNYGNVKIFLNWALKRGYGPRLTKKSARDVHRQWEGAKAL